MTATLLLLLLAASQSSLPSVPVTACSAVSQDEVQRAVGRSVGRGVEENARSQSTCDYEGKSGLVTVAIHNLDSGVSLDAQQKDLRSALPGAVFRPASVASVAGFFVDVPEAGTQLHLLPSARKYVIVTVLGFSGSGDLSASAQSIAATVLSRLGSR